jgi:hypothetical protein
LEEIIDEYEGMVSFSIIDYPSPWPLPKLLYGYSSYVYVQNCSSVILSFYIIKVCYVLLYYLDNGAHPSWFDGLGDYDSETGTTIEPSVVSVVVGDLLYLLLGLTLAKLHVFVVKYGTFFGFIKKPHFMTVFDWIDIGVVVKTLMDTNDHRRSSSFRKPTWTTKTMTPGFENEPEEEKENINGFCVKLTERFSNTGCWPPQYIFPWCSNCLEDIRCIKTRESSEMVKWLHRKSFWFYLMQSLVLGSPVTAVYSVDSDQSLRSGVLVYFLLQCLLLIVFYFWNAWYYKRLLSSYDNYLNENMVYEDSSDLTFLKTRNAIKSNKMFDATMYNAQYACWFLTILFFSIGVMIKTPYNVSLVVLVIWALCIASTLTVFVSQIFANHFHKEAEHFIYFMIGLNKKKVINTTQ